VTPLDKDEDPFMYNAIMSVFENAVQDMNDGKLKSRPLKKDDNYTIE